MADLGGFSANNLKHLIRREVHRQDSTASVETIIFLTRNQKISRYSLLAVALTEYLSSVILCLLAVSTLPYWDAILAFLPSFTVAIWGFIAGGYSVTIVWLDLRFCKHRLFLKSALVINILAQIWLIITILVAVGLIYVRDKVGVIIQAMSDHTASLMVLTPIALISFVISGWILSVHLIIRIKADQVARNRRAPRVRWIL